MKRCYAFALLALLLATVPAAAQTYGEVTGTVTDPSGAVIAGTKVTITNTATSAVREVETNEAGNFNVPFLTPGVYDLRAELEGFKTATQSGMIVQVGDVKNALFVLEIGAVTEVVEVQAAAQMLNTSDTALGQVISQQSIVDLPINGRNYLSLVKLSTNVSAEMGAGGQANSRQGGERANQSISISGQRQQYNRFTLDGVENTDPNFNTFVVRPSVDALQEFKVQTGVYSAEYGKATSQINVTTKAGSNQFHGTVFEFLRNDKIQARTWNQPGDKDPFRRNQFGFTATGPIVKNKIFFMANYEGFRERRSGFAQATVADQAMRSGDFSNPSLLDIYDPDTIRVDPNNAAQFVADQFPNQQIPQARFKQPFVQLLDFLPGPNIPGAITGDAANNYTRNTPEPLDWDQFTTRIDWNESAKSQWFGRYSYGTELVTDGQTFEFQDRFVDTKVDQFMMSNVRTFSPTVVNELRLGANFFDNGRVTIFNGVRDVTSELGIPGLNPPVQAAWGSPNVGMSGTSTVRGWGETTSGPFIVHNRTYQILDNLSWIRGKHTIKFGGELADRRFNQVGNQFSRGNLAFNGRFTASPDPDLFAETGEAFASGLLGWMSEATRAAGIANVQFRQNSFALYAEDSWKATSKLTVTLGVRYEYTPPFKDRYRGIFNIKLSCPGVDNTGIDESCPVPVQVRPGSGPVFEGMGFRLADFVPVASGDDVLFNHALVQRDTNDFAPRIGFAYQLGDKTTIRTGYGVYYSQDTGNPIFDMGRNFGARQSARSADVRPEVNLDDPWGGIPAGQCSGWDGPCFNALYTFGNDARRRTPYIQQYMLNIQRQLTDTLMLEVGYSGNLGRKLQRMYGFNTPTQRADPTDRTSLANRRPWGQKFFGRIQTIGNVSNSNYNALAVKLQQRHSSGLTYLLGYTFGRSIDGGSAIRTNSGDNLFPVDSYDLRNERGLSQFQTKHRFTGSIIYDIPLKFQNRVAQTLAGGWQVGSIVTIATGQPFNGGSCGDLNSNSQSGNRGDATGVDFLADNPSADRFFTLDPTDGRGPASLTCFTPVVIDGAEFNELSAREGTVGRNYLIGPGFGNIDFSVMKNFRITEKYNMQFRFESFNMANNPQLNRPRTGRNDRRYGIITSARAMRTNQFALKFIF